MKSIGVFCGSSTGLQPGYAAAAHELGRELALRHIRVIYGGGNAGLMGIVADAALAAGGEVVGVIPQFLVDKEVAHRGLAQLHIVESMHERKALMAEMSDHFVALPGGFGTLDELCEMLTWGQLQLHSGYVGLLNIEGYYDSLIDFFDRTAADGFLRSGSRERVLVGATAAEMLDILADPES
jgi:uncharacterized protein (TIGR00730 family)